MKLGQGEESLSTRHRSTPIAMATRCARVWGRDGEGVQYIDIHLYHRNHN